MAGFSVGELVLVILSGLTSVMGLGGKSKGTESLDNRRIAVLQEQFKKKNLKTKRKSSPDEVRERTENRNFVNSLLRAQ